VLVITHVATMLIFDVESDIFKVTVTRKIVKMCAEFIYYVFYVYLPAVYDSRRLQVEAFEGKLAMLIPHTTPVLFCVDICTVRKTTRHRKSLV
jgi:hypothetical protein